MLTEIKLQTHTQKRVYSTSLEWIQTFFAFPTQQSTFNIQVILNRLSCN